MTRKRLITPFSLPIYFFLAAIGAGAVLLHMNVSQVQGPISWLDALFTATSAVCVTGLIVVDTGSFFSPFGQSVILCLIQLGGLGVMTYTSLMFYLWRRRISLTDRISVGQSLIHDPTFHLGRFLFFVIGFTLLTELLGAAALYLLDPRGFTPGQAVFHSISAFCNAGFSLNADSLMAWRSDLGINLVFMTLIVLGGLGFSVVSEGVRYLSGLKRFRKKGRRYLSFHTRVVLHTSLYLVLGGAVIIFLAEYFSPIHKATAGESLLSGLFQSVTCRTAGFNTVDIGAMTNVSLFFMLLLMFVGGSPGSTAGGVKTTTMRTIAAFIVSQIKGRGQTVMIGRAVDRETLNKALTLVVFGGCLVFSSTLILSITEGRGVPHHMARGDMLELFFEVVSAFGTVGLSTGVTPTLSVPGKLLIMFLMFLGRLGPILFLSALRHWQERPHYDWPEDSVMIG